MTRINFATNNFNFFKWKPCKRSQSTDIRFPPSPSSLYATAEAFFPPSSCPPSLLDEVLPETRQYLLLHAQN